MSEQPVPAGDPGADSAGPVDISIVIPLLNEEDSLRPLMQSIQETMADDGRSMGRPLHLFGTMGIVLGALGTAINAYIAFLWLRAGNIQHRYPLLSLGVLLSVLGVQFVCTGLLADMIARSSQPNEKYNIRKFLR